MLLDEATIAELEALDINYNEQAYIKKVGKEWCVFSDSGRNMGCRGSRKAAEKRLAQVEMFKHMKKKGSVDFELSSVTYCYCGECGAEFISHKRCDLSKCPVCGDTSNNYEITGLIG